MANPINNPGVPPIQPSQGPTQKPSVGAEEAQPRPFSLPQAPNEGQGATIAPGSEKPTPMDVARDAEREQHPWTPDQMNDKLGQLQNQLTNAKTQLNDPNRNRNFTQDHYNALSTLVGKMNPDMNTIAKTTNGQFSEVKKARGQSVLEYVTKWIDGSQNTLSGALNYLQTVQKPDPATYLRLQFAVQRATQRGELFASIIGSSVSGIKTIMSTQLG